MKAILPFYLKYYIRVADKWSVEIYHIFNVLCYLSPILGAIIADSYWGKYKTILIISCFYAVGNIVMGLTAIPALGAGEGALIGPIIALIIIGFCTGGIKPCVAAFGGDQFGDNDKAGFTKFFSLFYLSINCGSCLSMFLTPLIRARTTCFGDDTCYSLAFGIPAVLMIVAILAFFLGDIFTKYTKVAPKGNVFGDFVGCIFHAIKRKFSSDSSPVDHWMDRASDKYSSTLISDVKSVLKVLVVIWIPIPMFWALFDQQGSRWTFQAGRMNNHNIIPPDQLQVVNAFLVIACIPLFDKGIYPALNKMGFAMRPLQRIGVGLFLTGMAFIVSGFVELQLTTDLKMDKPGYLTIINPLDTPINANFNGKDHSIPTMHEGYLTRMELETFGNQEIVLNETSKVNINVTEHGGAIAVLTKKGQDLDLTMTQEVIAKPPDGNVWINVLSQDAGTVEILKGKKVDGSAQMGDKFEKFPGTYSFQCDKKKSKPETFQAGGTYTLFFHEYSQCEYYIYINTKPNELSIFWQLPQYVLISAGEIMVSITGLSFAYSQAPESMKSILQACWLFAIALGNIFVIIQVEAAGEHSSLSLSFEFFLFGGLCLACTLLHIFIAMRYKYVDLEGDDTKVSPETSSMEMKEIPNGDTNKGFEAEN